MAGPDAATIRAALRCGRAGCECARPRGNVHCPAHEDADPSLSVTERGGKVLVHCHAGCSQPSIVQALRKRGVWPGRGERGEPTRKTAARVTRYDLRDPEGRLVAVHVREDRANGKQFWWERPDGTRDLGGTPVSDLPLYGVHLLKDRPGEPVILCEGEKAAQALLDAGRLAVGTVTGAAGTPSDEALRPLLGRVVLVWPDADGPGRAHMARIGTALVRLGVMPRLVTWADAPGAGDAADFLAQDGAAEELDQLLAAAAQSTVEAPALADLLGQVEIFLGRFVVFASPHQRTALALWIPHTHAIDAFEITPYVWITSPERECGKTRVLEVLTLLVARPWFTCRTTVAALARKIERDHPTLLLDETDAMLRSGEEYTEALRGILNAGYARNGVVTLCLGPEKVPHDLHVFTPKAFAGLRDLPDTVESRSIPIRLRRRAPGEQAARFRERSARAESQPIRDALARWAASPGMIDRLREARPEIPDALGDRQQDIWEALLAIADLAGGDWPQRARAAAIALHEDATIREETAGTATLRALRDIFEAEGTEKVPTATLLAALVDRDDGPWAEWWGKPVRDGDTRGPARRLARLMRPYGIEPVKWGSGNETIRGYRRADFEEAWGCYLHVPPPPPPPEGSLHAADAAPLDGQGRARGFGNAALNAAGPLTPRLQPLINKTRGVAASSGLAESTHAPTTPIRPEDVLPEIARRLGGLGVDTLPPDDGERVYLRALAETWDWPSIYIGGARPSWRGQRCGIGFCGPPVPTASLGPSPTWSPWKRGGRRSVESARRDAGLPPRRHRDTQSRGASRSVPAEPARPELHVPHPGDLRGQPPAVR